MADKYDVFISYRRYDSADRAQLIRSYLAEWFDYDRIFLDTHDIHEGPFPDYIREALEAVKYVVVIVSKASFGDDGDKGDIDYYREEIRLALARGVKVIPVVYDGIDIGKLDLPESLAPLKIQNAIVSHPDDPEGLKNRLREFTRKRERTLRDWVVFPLAVFTIYLVVSLISGIGMYVADNCFTDYDEAVGIAAEHITEHDGIFYYVMKDELASYDPRTDSIAFYDTSAASGSLASISVDELSLVKIGFWTTATGLVYQMVKAKYKPSGGKQLIAYIGAAVAVAAGVGLGCTVERMIFPQFQCSEIRANISSPTFWQDVINLKYSRQRRQILR